MKIYVCHSCGYDYKTELYDPLRESSLDTVHEIFLPHEGDNAKVNTTEIIKDADLILAEVSLPSTGQGIELGRAEVFGKKVLCISKEGSHYSGALRFVAKDFRTYSDKEEMIQKIQDYILAL